MEFPRCFRAEDQYTTPLSVGLSSLSAADIRAAVFFSQLKKTQGRVLLAGTQGRIDPHRVKSCYESGCCCHEVQRAGDRLSDHAGVSSLACAGDGPDREYPWSHSAFQRCYGGCPACCGCLSGWCRWEHHASVCGVSVCDDVRGSER